MAARHRFTTNSDETEPLFSSDMQEQVTKPWDKFIDNPREATVGSEVERTYINFGVKLLKVLTMLTVFCVVLGAAVVSKGTTLFMTSQLKKNVTRPYCNKDLNRNLQFEVSIPEVERVQWIWMLIFAYFVPEFGTWFRSVRKCLFKAWKTPPKTEILALAVTELCPAIGSAILIFAIFPEIDVVKGAMLTNAMCFVPGVVAMFSRNPSSLNDDLRMALDVVSIVAQASSFVVWPLIEDKPVLWLIPVASILISLGWWENFVSDKSQLKFIRELGEAKREFKNGTYFVYAFVAPLKCLAFLCTVLVIYRIQEGDVTFLFDKFSEAFQDRIILGTEISPIIPSNLQDAVATGNHPRISVDYLTAIWVWLINIGATYICYAFGKFSCKVMIQVVGFAFPINLSVPVLLSGLIAMCGVYYRSECSFTDTIPAYLFFELPPLMFLEDFLSQQHAWIWLIWLLSQSWIVIHIWSPNCDKLASTEQLFIRPMYDAFLIDQSLALNRRRVEEAENKETEQKEKITELEPETTESKDKVTRIYACGTMWHETKEEMIEFLKSILRLDQDQSAHRIYREMLGLKHSNYYELETHVFFDDAFVRVSKEDTDPHVNEYVELLASLLDEAAAKVHGTTSVKVRPPKIYPTPYGGRLVWTLPGKTKMTAHLKDKAKIRAKKRWSQCMYMYYLLGFRLQANEELSKDSKEIRGENTYILALDGDIDFQPEALHLLVDYMKKNKKLGAACGRIHPVGSGGMVWYQMFEYAVGHWLQKATEHVIGCVLCSPGCFSLFRGKALMDPSVMKKYTTRSDQPRHYVQYDQGEDRWLCTLLLQQGWRVEYSAASDAFTHCPEGFNEFYNQRRRWMPSTMANIMDLLMDYEHTVKVNENISMLYIFYQIILMIGTVIGPGTIFLMLVGAFVAAFGLDQWSSFLWNLVPIGIFIVVCATCNSDIQLFFAGLISAVYGLIMMAVFVGVMLQINEDGFLAPSSLFFFCLAGEFIIAALLHPQEFECLKYGVVYYVTVPSMYMLLVIYSVFNMNNVSWGTREVTIAPKTEAKPDEKDKKKEEKKPDTKDKILTFLGANAEDDAGAWEFSVNKLFKCMCCTYMADDKENEQLKLIRESIKELDKKLDFIERMQTPDYHSPMNSVTTTTFMEGSKATVKNPPDDFSDTSAPDAMSLPSDEVMENSWFYDGPLIRGEVHYLNKKEETFWNEFLEKYLFPYEDDKEKVASGLKDLRDKMVFTFFMLNSLFVLVVFLLTLKKDFLHLNWPIDPKVNFTYVDDKNEIEVYVTYLELEPIGFVFLIFFALLMVVQFGAMLIHRFGTFSQILTKTKIEFNVFKKSVNEMSWEELKEHDPLKIVKDLSKLKGINNDYEDQPEELRVDKRTTASNLAQAGRPSSRPVIFLDEAFQRRVTQIGNNEGRASEGQRKSVAFIQRRMSKAPGRLSHALPPNRTSLSSGIANEGFIMEDLNSDMDA